MKGDRWPHEFANAAKIILDKWWFFDIITTKLIRIIGIRKGAM